MKARTALILILFGWFGILSCGKKSSTGSSIDFEPLDFVKKTAGIWTLMNAHLALYDTTSGAVVDDADALVVFEALGSVPFGAGSAYAETMTGPTTSNLYWVADEDEALLYEGAGDPVPHVLLKSPLRNGRDWVANPEADPEFEIMAEILCSDTTLFLLGGVFHDVVRVRLTGVHSNPTYLVQEYLFYPELGPVMIKLNLYTRTDKLIMELVYSAEHMGTGGVPKVFANPRVERLLKKYRKYLRKG